MLVSWKELRGRELLRGHLSQEPAAQHRAMGSEPLPSILTLNPEHVGCDVVFEGFVLSTGPTSVPVYLVSPSVLVRALFRSKVDKFILHTQHANLRMVGQPK